MPNTHRSHNQLVIINCVSETGEEWGRARNSLDLRLLGCNLLVAHLVDPVWSIDGVGCYKRGILKIFCASMVPNSIVL